MCVCLRSSVWTEGCSHVSVRGSSTATVTMLSPKIKQARRGKHTPSSPFLHPSSALHLFSLFPCFPLWSISVFPSLNVSAELHLSSCLCDNVPSILLPSALIDNDIQKVWERHVSTGSAHRCHSASSWLLLSAMTWVFLHDEVLMLLSSLWNAQWELTGSTTGWCNPYCLLIIPSSFLEDLILMGIVWVGAKMAAGGRDPPIMFCILTCSHLRTSLSTQSLLG